MFYKATEHQINHVIELIGLEYQLHAPISNGKSIEFQKFNRASGVSWHNKRTVLPFKKFLFPNKQDIEGKKEKLAFLALPLCDIAALSLFLKQFESSGLIQDRKDLFIVGSECIADEHCFCDKFNLEKLYDFDLFILKDEDNFLVQFKGWKAKEIVTKIGLKISSKNILIKPKAKSDNTNLIKTERNIDDKKLAHDFWQGIANNCFGCGACSAVCPLCFCFDQDFENQSDGGCKRCINWTSCFASDFSQIQFGHDLRPSNTDRLYNWYHHKFVRAPRELGYPTCVGCGRCITACPAHLNIKSIITSLNKKYEK